MIDFSDDMEFVVGCNESGEREYVIVPVNYDVKNVLKQMIAETWQKMQQNDSVDYDPANQNKDATYLYMSIDDPLSREVRLFHQAEILQTSTAIMKRPGNMFCYCVRVTVDGQRLTAMRRASYFKGILKKRGRLIQIMNDTLKIIDDDVFKLDDDFDLLVWNEGLHIWKPTAFETLANIRQIVLQTVSENVKTIQDKIPFVCFNNIAKYAGTRIRAAKALSSLRQDDLDNIDRTTLAQQCRVMNVGVTNDAETMIIDEKSIGTFLEVLGRRRYLDPLVTEPANVYRAANRQLVKR